MNSAYDISRALRTLLAGFTQDTRLLRLSAAFGNDDTLLVEHVEGHEGLSEGFRFTITLLSPDAHLDTRQWLGQPALLQLLTQQSRDVLRPLHGHITAAEAVSADGGFARYRITLEPWLAFLRHRRDSYVWQGKTVLDIVQEIFGDYAGNGALSPAWRLDLADASQYKTREVCTQFEESDLAFVERLLAEEGLFYWFEHHGDVDDASFGSHTLVIADHNDAFTPNAQVLMPFQLPSAVEQIDSITAWHAEARIATNAIAIGSWNERQVNMIEARLDGTSNPTIPSLLSTDTPGIRRFDGADDAERAARLQLEALEARRAMWHGQGTVRTMATATTFSLADASGMPQVDRYVVVRAEHRARNNLTSDARELIEGLFGNASQQEAPADTPLYVNRFTAVRADVPWRPLSVDGQGMLLHPRPTVVGLQTATVVGVPGQDLTTERDHRVKVQMHWQRGSRSHSRLAHPQGDDNAPGNEAAYVWVRVATMAAGPNFGSAFIPRIGQEVVLDYIEGDIDRPIVTGSLYNGRGLDDAQGNQVAQGAGAATGNAPAWFAGNGHNAVLSGFKTQEIGNSQDGVGGYNQLVFDDSTGEVGARLQTAQHATQLNLGHIKRQQDNVRSASHGHGAELTTEAYGAVRAGQGLLISADARANASGTQMDAREAQEQLQQAHELQTNLADSAKQQNAFVGKTLNLPQHTQPEEEVRQTLASLAQTQEGTGGASGGAGTVPAFGRPDIVFSAPAGIVMSTAADVIATAQTITMTGAIDVSATVGRNLAVAAKSGMSLYTVGDAKATRKAQGDAGIKLHAAAGKLAVEAHGGQINANADKAVAVTSTDDGVTVAGKEHVLLTAGGAYLKIEGGNIQIHAPGQVQFKAGSKVLAGPASLNVGMPALPKADELATYSQRVDISRAIPEDEDFANVPYKVKLADGSLLQGVTDQDGCTARIHGKADNPIEILFGEGEWEIYMDINHFDDDFNT